jgi:hypothetical protein
MRRIAAFELIECFILCICTQQLVKIAANILLFFFICNDVRKWRVGIRAFVYNIIKDQEFGYE